MTPSAVLGQASVLAAVVSALADTPTSTGPTAQR